MTKETVQYKIEWDPQKAKINEKKHNVSFENAATVFKDLRAISVYDNDHSEAEDRWITMGLSSNGALLVVHHTFSQIDKRSISIRIISSRRTTKHEKKQYAE